MKKVLVLLLAAAMIFVLAACTTTEQTATSESSESAASESVASESASEEASEAAGETGETIEVVYIVPALDSEFYAVHCSTGFEDGFADAEKQFGVTVDYQLVGAVNEADTDEYIRIFENTIADQPDIICVSTLIFDVTAEKVAEAYEMGIPVYIYGTDFATAGTYMERAFTDQGAQGVVAADEFFRIMEENNVPAEGSVVGRYFPDVYPGIDDKVDTFKDRLLELAPEVTVLDVEHCKSDLNTAISQIEAGMTEYGDNFIGAFSGNNLTGDASIRGMEEMNIDPDNFINIAVDTDDEEIKGLQDGMVDAIIMQSSYSACYKMALRAIDSFVNGTQYETEYLEDPILLTQDALETLSESGITFGDLYPTEAHEMALAGTLVEGGTLTDFNS